MVRGLAAQGDQREMGRCHQVATLSCTLILTSHVGIASLTLMVNSYSLKQQRYCRRGLPLQMLRTGFVFLNKFTPMIDWFWHRSGFTNPNFT